MYRWFVVTVALAGLTACVGAGPTVEPVDSTATDSVTCKDPRPMVCTMEYRPVCAALVAGGEKTYPSGCNACADVAVASYIPEACEVN